MKKEILINNDAYYEVKYIVSKKKYAFYRINKKGNFKLLSFKKNNFKHRPCHIGPQYIDINFIEYYENNKLHNLYGPAVISKIGNTKDHYINDIHYLSYQFVYYISLYNNLTYKRIY